MKSIVKTDDVIGGEPRLEGRRVSVRQIAALAIDAGREPAYVADQLDIPLSEVHLALAYYYANPDEMNRVSERHRRQMRSARKEAISPPKTLTE